MRLVLAHATTQQASCRIWAAALEPCSACGPGICRRAICSLLSSCLCKCKVDPSAHPTHPPTYNLLFPAYHLPLASMQTWEVVLLRTDDGMHLQPSSLRPVFASLNPSVSAAAVACPFYKYALRCPSLCGHSSPAPVHGANGAAVACHRSSMMLHSAHQTNLSLFSSYIPPDRRLHPAAAAARGLQLGRPGGHHPAHPQVHMSKQHLIVSLLPAGFTTSGCRARLATLQCLPDCGWLTAHLCRLPSFTPTHSPVPLTMQHPAAAQPARRACAPARHARRHCGPGRGHQPQEEGAGELLAFRACALRLIRVQSEGWPVHGSAPAVLLLVCKHACGLCCCVPHTLAKPGLPALPAMHAG